MDLIDEDFRIDNSFSEEEVDKSKSKNPLLAAGMSEE